MKVSELIEQLKNKDQDAEVVISVDVPHVTIGGSPRVEVGNVISGFDWDDGVVFLHPPIGTNLIQTSRGEFRELIEWKQLVSGIRGKADIEEAKKEFIRKEDLRLHLSEMIKTFDLFKPSEEE